MQDPSYSGYGTNQKALNNVVSRNEAEIQSLEETMCSIREHEKRDIDEWRGFADKKIKALESMIDRIKSNTDHLVETRISMSRYETDPIEEMVKALKRKNQLLLASIAPISKLPNEVLGLIFEEFAAMDECIWPLTKVSERWSQTAFSTHSIWSRIVLTKSTGTYNTFTDGEYKRYFRGSYHVCLDDQDFTEAILRAGARRLLDLNIDYHHLWTSDNHNDFIASLKVLMKREVATRIRCLYISVQSNSIATQWPECFQSIPLEKLQIFTVRNLPQEWRQNLFQSISTWTKTLKSFTNSQTGSMLTLPDQAWKGMRYIDFNDNTTPGEMDRLCHKIPHIKNLDGLPKGWPSASTPLCIFHDLQSITLDSEREHVRRIQWPAMQRMEIVDSLQSAAASTERSTFTVFPKLTSFKISSNMTLQWLLNVNMPLLTTLHIDLSRSYQNPDYSALSASDFPLLHDLSIEFSYNTSAATSLIRALPQITSLTISATRYSDGDVAIIRRLSEFSRGFTYCPNLQEIQIGRASAGTYSRKSSVKAAIKRLISARKKHNSEIRSIVVFWKLDPHPQQHVPA